MDWIKARPVRPGGCIGVVAPAGPVVPERLEAGLARLHSWGYRTRVGEHVLDRRGYLAGDDAARAADFNRIWADPEVDAVICARGGYGAMRILERVDWAMVRATPKFFCGFSDITALHLAMARRAGLVTFHGPMVAAFGDAEAYNGEGLRRALESTEAVGEIPWPDGANGITLRPGVAEGRLLGGNLTLLTALLGTPWEPDLSGCVLLLEDVGEAVYRIDRMLMQFRLSGRLRRVAGILFGETAAPQGEQPTLTLMDVLREHLGGLGVPVLYGFPCGHGAHRATLPLGVRVRLDAGAGRLTILEPAVEAEPG